jgi:2-iminobutanoate/2-iminopropanoate deaminase
MDRAVISTKKAPAAPGPYQAVVAGGFVLRSGTFGIDPETGPVRDGIEAQTGQAVFNLALAP